MEYTITALAALSGVSSRTLRWYDQTGLLRPMRTTQAGYRVYGPAEVARLQQILFYRALGVSLAAIGQILDDPGFDPHAALEQHLSALLGRRAQLDALIATVTKTLAQQEGGPTMSDLEKFEAFKKQLVTQNEQQYGAEARSKYGDNAVDEANAALLSLCSAQYEDREALGEAIRRQAEDAVRAGLDPAGPVGQALADAHRRWLSFTQTAYSPQMHAGIAALYVADPRFTAYYDGNVPGCAAFINAAVQAYTATR